MRYTHIGELYRQVRERKLTPQEIEDREKIAKKLPMDDFKKRYGKDAMAVKMATATNIVKKKSAKSEVKEDGHTDVASAIRQCKTVTEDAMQILQKLKSMSPEDSLPSWWTNKLAVASNSMNKLRDYFLVPSVSEEVELDEKAGDIPDLQKLIGELQNASKMHLAQSKRVQAHVDMMTRANAKGPEGAGGLQDLKKIVGELEKASQAHLRQSKSIDAHVDFMNKMEAGHTNLAKTNARQKRELDSLKTRHDRQDDTARTKDAREKNLQTNEVDPKLQEIAPAVAAVARTIAKPIVKKIAKTALGVGATNEQFDFVLLDKDNKIVARASGKNAKKEMESSKRSAHLPPMRIPKNEVGKMKIVPISPRDKKDIGDMVLAIGEKYDHIKEMIQSGKFTRPEIKKMIERNILEKKAATGYTIFHKTFSDAMQHAYAHAKSKMGMTVDKKEIDSKVATGPKKPSEGKTNRYSLKTNKGTLQVQVYNRGGSKPFELNMYSS